MKILMAVDGSEFTQRLLDFVIGHPELLGTAPQLTLLNVVPAIPPHAANYVASDILTGYYVERGEAVLEPVLAKLKAAGIAATAMHDKGHAAECIAEHASAGRYDLLLMGSHGQSALGGLLVGSVVTGVLARCRTPVLVVR